MHYLQILLSCVIIQPMSLDHLVTQHGVMNLPVFLPDATFGVVRGLDASDLCACGVQALVMNTFHLMQKPGSSTVQSLGGLHAMAGWSGPIVTDSGGFQAYSLIHQHNLDGSIIANGIEFTPEGSHRKFLLTPEKSVQLQLGYGSDVVICLDDCTHVDAPESEQTTSVSRTIDWAKRGKCEYLKILGQKKMGPHNRPLLFAVIQGGGVLSLRKQCAEQLLGIGFDGFGFGGWPLDGQGQLLTDILAYTRELIPPGFPLHALGVGHPANLAACASLGYDLFDSAMPTRDARHGRLYSFLTKPDKRTIVSRHGWLHFTYVNDVKHIKSDAPVSEFCDCHTCQHYSLGYLRHLFKIEDSLYKRLATIHNVRFMTKLTDLLSREADVN
jgi:queuine tRNA-ribosyltransferase